LVNRPKIGDLGRSARLHPIPAGAGTAAGAFYRRYRQVLANLKTIVETSLLQTIIPQGINLRSY